MSNDDVTPTCIQVMSPIFKNLIADERKSLVNLANLILALIDVRFFNTDDKNPHDPTDIYAVSLEGALIWKLPDQQMLEIACVGGVKYDAYLYTSHEAWCDAHKTDNFPTFTRLTTNNEVIDYLKKRWYTDM